MGDVIGKKIIPQTVYSVLAPGPIRAFIMPVVPLPNGSKSWDRVRLQHVTRAETSAHQ